MKNILVFAAIVLSACSTVTPTKTATPTQFAGPRVEVPAPAPAQAPVLTQAAAPAPEQAVPVPGAEPPISGLSDLEAITFGCPKAGLNAAAREAASDAAKAPARGQYQFSYFKVISDSHHSLYEVHFKSNNHEDRDLKYCVAVYCQQGWDPKTTKPLVSPMSDGPAPTRASAAGAAHGAHCGADPQTPVKRRPKR